MNYNELWQAVIGELELTISKPNFNTWFKHPYISNLENGEAVICVPNTFTKAWLERKYHLALLKALGRLTNLEIRRLIYRVEIAPVGGSVSSRVGAQPVPVPPLNVPQPKITTVARPEDARGLNQRYTFGNFIVGKGNELAHAAAQAVVTKPGTTYNPLFIYGGAGLGKTHLLQAIGQATLEKTSNCRVLYVTCERFVNDYIHAVRSGRGKEFKETYRTVDLLLVDDIQFITGKEGSQEEFFHTFNTLHQTNKQIVISSDRPPRAIATLEHRLLTRFEWGMMADISSPDLETRVAILETKCRERNFDLSREILLFLANVIQSNVRELEGALTKIIAVHQFKNLAPSLETIKPILTGFGQSGTRGSLSPRQVISIVAQYFDVPTDDLLGKSREKRLAFPRQIVMYLMREELKSSYPAIGHELGGRDHTTAMHAYDKISRELEANERFRQDFENLRQRLFISS